MFSVPNIAVENAMACLVFRGLCLGSLSDDYGDTSELTTLRFESAPVSKDSPRKDFPEKVHSIESGPHRPPIAIEMTQMTEFQYDDGRDPGENESHRTDWNRRIVLCMTGAKITSIEKKKVEISQGELATAPSY
jgi:hypothetical protein